MSRSRERQKYIRLRSEERRLQQLEADERRRLFGDVHVHCSAVSLSEPAVGMPSKHIYCSNSRLLLWCTNIAVKANEND